MKIAGISACARHSQIDHKMDHRITDITMETRCASYFTASEQQLLMELYEEVKDKIRKKGHTATVKRERLADDCGPAQCISSQKKKYN